MFSPRIVAHEMEIESKHEMTTLNSNPSRMSRDANLSYAGQMFTPVSQVIKVARQHNAVPLSSSIAQRVLVQTNQMMLNFPKIHIQSTSREMLAQSFRESAAKQAASIDSEKHLSQPEFTLNPLLRKKWLNKRH